MVIWRATIVALGLAVVAVSGCAAHYIPNTEVEDTAFNRDVIQFCEEYRKAVERKNVGLLLQLAHPNYYEDGGNIDASDDLDYAGLKIYLQDRFEQAKAIRYEIRYRRVGKGRNDTIFVDYTYSASYKLPVDTVDVWRRAVADNRLELVRHKDTFRILAGM
jgi:hypothetical protein